MTAGSPGDVVMPPRFLGRILTVLALLSVATSAAAQPATPMPPAAAGGGGISLVASGLAAPRGMAWDPAGGMYVALAGSAGDMPGQGAGMGQAPIFAKWVGELPGRCWRGLHRQ